MEPSFWLERWQNSDIGFHNEAYHPALQAHWSKLGVEPPASVFVPLCGKSLDMEWLALRGHMVIGVELSEVAVDAFLDSQNLTPAEEARGEFIIKSAGPYEIWCGDLFALPEERLASVSAVYDRASLVALPPPMQTRYAQWLKKKLPDTPALIVSLGYDQTEINGPPFSLPEARVSELFNDHYDLQILSSDEVIENNAALKKRGVTKLRETVYLARRTS
jgi:thiopurine S-methyltransferase